MQLRATVNLYTSLTLLIGVILTDRRMTSRCF
jgi:hypothetical protein